MQFNPITNTLLEDLLEDYIGWCWNQGETSGLKSCEAIWNGEDFDILYEGKKEHV